MIRIELDPYEQKDLIEYLKYAIEQKELNRPVRLNPTNNSTKFDTTTYDVDRIKRLISIIEHPCSRTTIYKAQYTDNTHEQEKRQQYYDRVIRVKKQEEKRKRMEGLVEIL